MNITVTHTLAPELIALFQGLFTETGNPQKSVQRLTESVKTTTPISAPITSPASAEADQDAPAKVTIEQLRLAVQEKSDKKVEIKALLAEFNAQNLSALLPESREGFLAKVKAL